MELLGAIVCCEEVKQNGWPLVNLDVLELFARRRQNYTHCRLGPFTEAGEDDAIYVGYVTVTTAASISNGSMPDSATNTGDPELERRLDYITRHSRQAQPAGSKPILVNEYSPLTPDEVLAQVREAHRLGTMFMYWRGGHSRAEWEGTLVELEREVEGRRLAATATSSAGSLIG